MRELKHSLRTARERSAEYDIAATIDAMAAIGGVEAALLRERDEICERLKICGCPRRRCRRRCEGRLDGDPHTRDVYLRP